MSNKYFTSKPLFLKDLAEDMRQGQEYTCLIRPKVIYLGATGQRMRTVIRRHRWGVVRPEAEVYCDLRRKAARFVDAMETSVSSVGGAPYRGEQFHGYA
jgi:hypothetical protein